MKRFLLVISALTMLCCQPNHEPAQAQPTQESTQTAIAQATIVQTDFTQVAAQTINAVVHIKTTMTKMTPLYESFFGFIIERGMQKQQYSAFGSGVIISHDGYIITNNHVVQDAESIMVTLNDNRVLPATIVGLDAATDLAVIKVEAEGLTTIPFGNSDLVQVGEPVLAIGNPFNLTSTVTAGIISAKARNLNILSNSDVETPIQSFLQTDAAVNSGNSGGALVNARGELIGVIAAIASGTGNYIGYSFAIPASIAIKVYNDLVRYGLVQRGYLGVEVSEVTPELMRRVGLENSDGLFLAHVFPQGAAGHAGLHQGDVLLKVNEQEIHSYSQMMEALVLFSPGESVEVTYRRGNKTQTAHVTLLNENGNTDVVRKR